jgi:hypothetical protein
MLSVPGRDDVQTVLDRLAARPIATPLALPALFTLALSEGRVM